MSAVEPLMEAPAPRGKAADCVAFVGDNQTHNVVDTAAQQFYPDALVRDGDSSDALAFLAETQAPRVLIVDIGDSASPLSAMLSLMTAVGDETRVIGIGSVNDISLYRELAEAGWTHPGKVEAPYTVCIASASNLTGLVKSSVECRRTGL